MNDFYPEKEKDSLIKINKSKPITAKRLPEKNLDSNNNNNKAKNSEGNLNIVKMFQVREEEKKEPDKIELINKDFKLYKSN
jgi:hypothetical protein